MISSSEKSPLTPWAQSSDERSPLRVPSLSDLPPPFAIGERIAGVYEVLSLLGEGGMGVVVEAHDLLLNRTVAIKTSNPGVDKKLLAHEARVLAAVQHPALVAVHAFGNHKGVDYLVMERLYGITLREHMRATRDADAQFPFSQMIEILLSLAEALAAVHRANIAHRDVKPSNVILSPGNRTVLVDFGLFVRESNDSSGDIVGSPAYMAPEVLFAMSRAGEWHLADLYSLGVLAYEMLTGRRPFDGNNATALMQQHLSHAYPDARALRPDVPRAFTDLLHSMLSIDPAGRPESAEKVAHQLREMRSATQASDGISPRPFTVLVVEDDPVQLAAMTMYVRKVDPGARVVTATNGKMAIDMVRRTLPDVVLLDLGLPYMNGVEVCMHLRATKMTERCSIVSVSGSAKGEDLRLLQQIGVMHFLAKGPELREQLMSIVRMLHRSIG